MHTFGLTHRKNKNTLSFCHPGWWILHTIAIIIVLTIGYCLCDD